MNFSQPPVSPPDDREPASSPGGFPPYAYAPPMDRAAETPNGAAIASLVIAIISLVPGWLSPLVVASSRRAGFSITQVSAAVTGISLVGAAVAVIAVICGHIGWNRSRASIARPGGVPAVIGLTLGYGHLAGAILSFLVELVVAAVAH